VHADGGAAMATRDDARARGGEAARAIEERSVCGGAAAAALEEARRRGRRLKVLCLVLVISDNA
jgi:hypothetical protein